MLTPTYLTDSNPMPDSDTGQTDSAPADTTGSNPVTPVSVRRGKTISAATPCCAAIIAGGQSRRMGGTSKALLPLAGKPLLQHVIDRLQPQADLLVLNTNQPLPMDNGLPQISDSISGFGGPLVGILAVMEWLQQHQPHCQWLALSSVDTPFIPADLIQQLQSARQSANATPDIICPTYADRQHPLCGLWHTGQASALRLAISRDKLARVGDWLASRTTLLYPWPTQALDPFTNINTPADLQAATDWLSQHAPSTHPATPDTPPAQGT